MGNAIYRELAPFYDVHATYNTDNASLEANQHFHLFDMETNQIVLQKKKKPIYSNL